MADAETFGRETDGADTPCLRPAPFFKPLLTPLPIKSGKRVRDATLLSIFQFFTFAARI